MTGVQTCALPISLERVDGVVAVRGLGLLLAAELDEPCAKAAAAAALADGLVVNAVTDSALRLAPSLLVTDDEMDEAVEILAGVSKQVRNR